MAPATLNPINRTPLDSRIKKALRKDDLAELAQAVDDGADINSISKRTASRIQWLLQNGYRDFENAAQEGQTGICRGIITLANTFNPPMVRRLLMGGRYKAFREAAANGHIDTCRYLAGLIPSPGESIQLLRAYQYTYDNAFIAAAKNGHTDTCRYLIEFAHTVGSAELQRELLDQEKFHAFESAAEKNHIDTCRYLVGLAETLGGAAYVGKMLQKTPYHTHNCEETIVWAMSRKEALPELRERWKRAVGRHRFSIAMPSHDDIGIVGQPSPYAAALNVMLKVQKISDAFGDVKIDLKKMLANHRDSTGRPMVQERQLVSSKGKGELMQEEKIVWNKLSDAMDPVSHKKIGEICDTVREVSGYMAGYLLAEEYKDRKKELKSLDNERLAAAIKPHRDRVIKYFFENKTFPQMARVSDQWHRFRISKIKTSEDQSTLRDFAQSGSWHQVTKEKEIMVTAPGLEGYSLVNLTNSQDLMDEHHALGHCVDGYVDDCKQGYQVFSIRRNGVPQTTMGFTIKKGGLKFEQNLGEDNRDANTREKAVAEWFLKSIQEKTIKIDLSNIGEIVSDTLISAFENTVGVRVEDLTGERIQSNLNLITGMAKEYGQWSEKAAKHNTYMFGSENAGATLAQFKENMERAANPTVAMTR